MAPSPEALSHPLANALRDAGFSLRDAAGYMLRLNAFGQVGFSSGGPGRARLAELRTIRDGALSSLSNKDAPRKMGSKMLLGIIPHGPNDLRKVDGSMQLTVDVLKKAAKDWAENDDFHFGRVAKLADLSRDEMIGILCGADLDNAPPFDTWARLDHAASARAGTPPSMADGSSPPDAGTLCLEPAKIEALLEGKARALMDRFGLADIRISGLPSFEKCDATLDSLEISLSEIARGAGIPEKAIGLGGAQCIHVNADVGRASGYCSDGEPDGVGAICLSPDNGWRTLAHEWFHAFDAIVPPLGKKSAPSMAAAEQLAASGKLSGAAKGARAADSMAPADWAADRLLAYSGTLTAEQAKASLLRSAHAVISGLRAAPGRDALADISREETEASVKRIRDGLYERFYKNRVEPGLEAQAEQRFSELCRSLLDGKAQLADVASWRKAHLGSKAAMCQHYDAFVVAEREARDSRVAAKMEGAGEISTMQRFAKLADEHLAAATGGSSWAGYSSSATEMSARGFEGNCFLDTPDPKRSYLVDGRDNSMYWPAGAERGAHREKYRAYFAHGVMAMIGSGLLKPDALGGFDPASDASPAIPEAANIGAKLAARRTIPEQPLSAAQLAPAKAGI